MSWLAIDWAETTPVADVYERVILMSMATRAKKDGTGVYLSPATIARRNPCDQQTIKDRMKALEARGVIRLGDQRIAAHIPANRRPNVYDLMIPASYYSPSQLADVNAEREERGLGPLDLADRPDLPVPPPSRKARSDKGKPNPAKAPQTAAEQAERSPEEQPLTWDDAQGGVVDPPAEIGGGSTTPPQGGLVDPSRGVYYTPNSLREIPEEVRGGGVTSPDAPAAAEPSPAPPSSAIVFDLDDESTWLCRKHRENPTPPDEERPGCGPCGRTAKWARAELAKRAERERRAALDAEQRERECRWCAEHHHVLDPDTGRPLEPAVKCDHVTPPEVRKAQLLAELAEKATQAPAAAPADVFAGERWKPSRLAQTESPQVQTSALAS